MKESKVMEELHKIREKIYEEEKNMSIEERVKKTREESEKYIKEHNLKLKRIPSKKLLTYSKKTA
ncbi:MAG: hypothetical protein QG641_394 [Candidatus Poribacteria bacterium]|nr:hypothetical protein [Candidatus Poribacteria bacterium]